MKTYLEERIEWYDDNYRNGNALISNKQFDQLEKNLLRTNPNCDYFKKKNKLVLPSLEKDSIDEFLRGLLADTRLLIEPKIDGCAVALQYRDGTLEKAISRKGTDVTSKLIKVQDIPSILPLEECFKLEVNYTRTTKVQISPKESLLDFSELKRDFLKILAFAHFKYLIQHLTNMSPKRVFQSLASLSLRIFHATLQAKLKYLENNGYKGSFLVNIQQME